MMKALRWISMAALGMMIVGVSQRMRRSASIPPQNKTAAARIPAPAVAAAPPVSSVAKKPAPSVAIALPAPAPSAQETAVASPAPLVEQAPVIAQAPARAAEDHLIGVAAAVAGKVMAFAGAQGEGRVLSSRAPLYVGDKIVTDGQGQLQVMLLDETVFALGPDGSMILEKFAFNPANDDGKVVVRINSGSYRFSTGRIAHKTPANMTVNFPDAVLDVRGTIVSGHAGAGGTYALLLGPGPNKDGERVGAFTLRTDAARVDVDRPGFGSHVDAGSRRPSAPTHVSQTQLGSLLGSFDSKGKKDSASGKQDRKTTTQNSGGNSAKPSTNPDNLDSVSHTASHDHSTAEGKHKPKADADALDRAARKAAKAAADATALADAKSAEAAARAASRKAMDVVEAMAAAVEKAKTARNDAQRVRDRAQLAKDDTDFKIGRFNKNYLTRYLQVRIQYFDGRPANEINPAAMTKGFDSFQKGIADFDKAAADFANADIAFNKAGVKWPDRIIRFLPDGTAVRQNTEEGFLERMDGFKAAQAKFNEAKATFDSALTPEDSKRAYLAARDSYQKGLYFLNQARAGYYLPARSYFDRVKAGLKMEGVDFSAAINEFNQAQKDFTAAMKKLYAAINAKAQADDLSAQTELKTDGAREALADAQLGNPIDPKTFSELLRDISYWQQVREIESGTGQYAGGGNFNLEKCDGNACVNPKGSFKFVLNVDFGNRTYGGNCHGDCAASGASFTASADNLRKGKVSDSLTIQTASFDALNGPALIKARSASNNFSADIALKTVVETPAAEAQAAVKYFDGATKGAGTATAPLVDCATGNCKK